jgi:hypothetical protein
MPDSDHKRCLTCGYILDGLPEPRCPECGRGFDPRDPSTFRGPPVHSCGTTTVWTVVLSWLIAGALGLVLIGAAEADVMIVKRNLGAIWPMLGFAACACNFLVLLKSGFELRKQHKSGHDRGAWRLAFILALIGVIAACGCLGFIWWTERSLEEFLENMG